jgi:hypothetical protein
MKPLLGTFKLTSLPAGLQSGVPGSLRARSILVGKLWDWSPWTVLLHSMQTSLSASSDLSPYNSRNTERWLRVYKCVELS